MSILHFTWRTAIFGRFDVFHVHWPEALIGGGTRVARAARQLLYFLFLVRIRLFKVAIVRTRHNIKLPEDISSSARALLRLTERWTTVWIGLNRDTPFKPSEPHHVILHGDYRDWFKKYEPRERVAGRLVFFGLIRRYKGVGGLIDAFRQIDPGQKLSLEIVGRPSTPDLASDLRERAGADPRIHLRFEFLSDQDLVHEVSAAELVVLPYRDMHNSAGVLTALSLDRPVLVPDNDVNRALALEVGAGWIFTYSGELDASDISNGISAARRSNRSMRPKFASREWDGAADQHLLAYRQALQIRRRSSV